MSLSDAIKNLSATFSGQLLQPADAGVPEGWLLTLATAGADAAFLDAPALPQSLLHLHRKRKVK